MRQNITFNEKDNRWAAESLYNISPEFSAAKLWSGAHIFNGILLILAFSYLLVAGYNGLVLALNVGSFLFFLYRFTLSIIGLRGDKDSGKMVEYSDDLPKYCILLPMRNEPCSVVSDLINNIDNLNYPKHRMDVVMLVDEDDDYLEDIKMLNIPDHFRIISASALFPFTKPKVCNLGLYDTDAEYVTIYDAEDKPEPDQLLKVLYKFKSENVSCVQCRLHYANKNPNWLTKFFTNEYLTWFSLTIRGLSISQNDKGVIPLGGTSQHLKVDELKELGGWDAFNVTEDCELGVRMVRKGKRIVISDSVTEEIAVSKLKHWIPQRTRWQLGFMVTYLVHSKRTPSLIRDLGFYKYIHFILSVLGNVLSPLITPLLFVIFVVSLFWDGNGETYLNYLPTITLICNYLLIVATHAIASIKHNNGKYLWNTFLQPLYYLFQAVTVYRAVWKLITAPHKWEKTAHEVED